jgi:hypothetical protein
VPGEAKTQWFVPRRATLHVRPGERSIDPKFVLPPGSTADARFELSWAPGNAIVASTFELHLTVSEINSVEGNQHTLGGEFPMTFRGLVNKAPLRK